MGIRLSWLGRRNVYPQNAFASMKHFDKIFVVSLPNEVGAERMHELIPHLQHHEVDFEVWSASENENGVVGLLRSMHGLFTWCLQEDYKTILVLEDDSVFKVPFWPFMDEV